MSAATLASARGSGQSWRSRRQRHDRREVDPSQPPVQDKVQNWEMEGVRAWPQEPRRCHDLAEQGCNCPMGSTEERSARRTAAVLESRDPAAWMLRVVFGLPQRQTEEFLDSLLRLMGRDLKAPDHTLSRSGTKSLRCRPGPDPATARSTGSSIPGGSRFRVAANGTRTSTRHRRDAGMGGSCTSGVDTEGFMVAAEVTARSRGRRLHTP